MKWILLTSIFACWLWHGIQKAGTDIEDVDIENYEFDEWFHGEDYEDEEN